MKKILNLDLGITSIGFSILEEFENDRYSLVDYGVSMFDKPTDKDGNSKKLLHSANASTTKLYDLKKQRKQNLAQIFEDYNLSSKALLLNQEKQNIYINKWELRAKKAFKERLEIGELFSIFYALAKHRGYKSLDSGDLLEELCLELGIELEERGKKKEDEERGKIKKALQTVETLRVKSPDKTVAQIIYETEIQKEHPVFRNHDNYNYMIRREYINDEIKKIIKAQDSFGLFDFNTDEFAKEIIKVIDDQKDSTNDLNLFGNCEYFKDEKVAHQYSLLSDIFKMYQSVSNITFNKKPTIKITPAQIKLIADDFFAKIKKGKSIADLKYKDVRKILKLSDDIKIFNKDDGKLTITKFHFISNLSKINNQFILDIFKKENKYEILKKIFDVLAYEKAPHAIYEQLKEMIDDEKTIIDLIRYKNGNSLQISHHAMIKFIPYFEQGLTTDEIKKRLGLERKEDYSEFKKGIKYLHIDTFEKDDNLEINNHPVKYVVSATLRLIKHLHTTYGAFDEIRVESTRELSQNEQTKKDIEKANRALEKQLDEIVADEEYQKIAQMYGKNIRKYARKILMYKEQEGRDIYTGKGIEIADIFTNVVDLDHIVPQSLGGLSVKHNFVLAHRDTNVQKSNQLAINFVKDKQDFINRVEYLFSEHKINWKKKINLLATNLDEAFQDRFESKDLRATSYIEALTAQILKRYYPFSDEEKQHNGKAVRHIPGRAPPNIPKLLHVKTKVRDTNIHHAIDAILIGLTNQSWLKKLSNTFRENMGVIDDKAREKIKKDIPLIEGIEPKELVEMIEGEEGKGGYLYYGEDSVFYKDIWDKTRAVNFWVSKKPDSSNLHEKTIYGIDKINGKKDNKRKKYTGFTTLRVDIIKRLKDSQKKPDLPKVGDNAQEYLDEYNKHIVEKLYLYKYNKNDKLVSIIQDKGYKISNCLKKYENINKEDKEALQKAREELSTIIDRPFIDNNGNIIRRVKLIYSNKTNEDMIRGGTSVAESIAIGMSVSIEDKNKLKFKRIDFKNKLAKNLDKVLDKNSLNIYRNDLVGLVFKNEDKNFIANLESLSDKRGTALFYSSKVPKKVESQPKYLLQGKSRKEFGIKSAIGVIKLNLDIIGNIKSYQVIGNAKSELLDFIKEVIK